MSKNDEQRPMAYSYMRFSSPQQKGNDSIRRQTEARDAFVERNNLRLDDKIRLTDEGVSAHRGKHRSDATALGRFVALVRAGAIPKGSYLIVESLDRLSREDTDEALQFLLSLTNAGIKVVQLLPVEVIFEKPVDPMKLIVGIVEMSRGWSESKMKSERVGKAWKAKRDKARETKKAQTASCVRWLRRNGDHYELIPERAEAVRLMFKLCADGFGINQIIRRLVEGKHKPFQRTKREGKAWSASTINKTLRNRVCIGEYLPLKDKRPDGEPIANYYPSVVDENLFLLAQSGLNRRSRLENRKRKPRGGRYSTNVNLFSGLMRNAEDGDAIEYRVFHGQANRNGKSIAKYVNSKALVAQAKLVSFPVHAFEKCVLEALEEIKAKDILPNYDTAEDNVAVLKAQKEDVDARLAEIKTQLLSLKGGSVSLLSEAAETLTVRQRELGDQLAEAKYKATNPMAEVWSKAKTLIAALESAEDKEAARLRLRNEIRDMIAGLDCLFLRNGKRQVACVQLRFRESEKVRMVNIWHRGELKNRKDTTPEHTSWDTVLAEKGFPEVFREVQWEWAKALLSEMLEEENWHEKIEPNRPTTAQKIKARKALYMKKYKKTQKAG